MNVGGLGDHVTCFGSFKRLSFLLYTWDRTQPAPVDRFRRSIFCGVAFKSHFGGQMSQKPHSEGGKRLFKPIAQNIQTFVLSKLLQWFVIPTKLWTMIKTSKYLWVVPKCTTQIQDGGRPRSWKKINHYLSKRLANFDDLHIMT